MQISVLNFLGWLEQFKSTLDNKTRMYIEEKKPKSLTEAGKLADEFFLIYGQSKTDHVPPFNNPAREAKPHNKTHQSSTISESFPWPR